jgi:hypothetical protein
MCTLARKLLVGASTFITMIASFSPMARSQQALPSPLPMEVVAAWTKAGAIVGWMPAGQYGAAGFYGSDRGEEGQVPAFLFQTWTDDVVCKLPNPQRAFGMQLEGTEVGDAGLEELSGLKELQTLNLMNTRVTDAGLSRLTGLKGLQG